MSLAVKGAIKPAKEKAVNDRLVTNHDRSGSALVEGHELAQRLTGVELTGTADLLIRVRCISFQWAIQPMVREMAKITVNMDMGIPMAFMRMPERSPRSGRASSR